MKTKKSIVISRVNFAARANARFDRAANTASIARAADLAADLAAEEAHAKAKARASARKAAIANIK